MSPDRVEQDWFVTQNRERLSLNDQSDIVNLMPLDGMPPTTYRIEFHCNGLVRTAAGVEICDRHVFGIRFPSDYLRRGQSDVPIVTLIEPREFWHPNANWPFCCIGSVPPGMSLVNVVQQLFQIVTWQRFTPDEGDSLNPEACSWARRNIDSFPVDARRSLLRSRRSETGGTQ